MGYNITDRMISLTLTVNRADGFSEYSGHNIGLGGVHVAWRRYDGSSIDAICDEVMTALGALLRERTGWSEYEPDE